MKLECARGTTLQFRPAECPEEIKTHDRHPKKHCKGAEISKITHKDADVGVEG